VGKPHWRGRRFRGLGVVAFVLVVAAIWSMRARRDAAPVVRGADQNVLLITIDTLRADALGSYGGRAATPNLDRLAENGLRFTFAHAHAVMTLPSHASILTGRYPFDHGVRDNAGYRLDEQAETLAEIARRSGLATGAFVGAFPLDRQFGLAQGFDVYRDVGGRGVAEGDFAFTERRAEEVVAEARTWIEQQPGKWFVWVHVFDPHASYAPPAPFDTHYSGDPYAGEVAYVDHALGPLLKTARRSSRRTTVVVTADHGEGLGDHGEVTHGTLAYESTLKVPLILAQVGAQVGPGTDASRGRVVHAPVGHVDIVPTIAGLIGMSLPSDLPGRTLLDAEVGDLRRKLTYFEAMTPMLKRGWAPLSGVIAGRDKYISLPIEEMYNLEIDPREERNLVAEAGSRVAALAADLGRLGAALPGKERSESAEVRSRLQALGYVSGSAPRKARYTEADDPKRLIDVDRLMMEGIDFYRRGRTADAMAAYRAVIARRPDMGLAYRRLAFLQWEAGAPADAIATMRSALEKIGPDIDIEIRLGTYLAETGNAQEAIPILQRVTTAQPDKSEALNALGIAYAQAGRGTDALATFKRALQANPRDVYAHENIGTVYLQQKNVAAAREAFMRAVENDPRSSRGHAGLGVVAREQGRTDEAITHWRRAVQLDPTNFDALFNVATALAAAGRVEEARPFMTQFVRTAPRAFYARDIERFSQFLSTNR
jgi:arylsulfatase A-like enzyme/Flp pilus assembly protein TadD